MWFVALALAGPVEHTVLDNGLRVAVVAQPRADVVALHLRYGVGSRDEREGERGLSHLFEHLMFEGSANVPGESFDAWLSAAGGVNNAWTSEDATAYHLEVPAGGLERALFLESDRMGFLVPALTEDNLRNQQGVVLQERTESFQGVDGRLADAVLQLLFAPGHPYRVGPIGTVADVSTCTLPRAVDFHERWIRPDNAVLTVVGNIEPAGTLARIAHWFSDVPGRSGPVSVQPELPPYVPRHGYYEDDQDWRTLVLAWPTPAMSHPDRPALEVLAWVLSAGAGTRLDDALYYDRQLVEEVGVSHWPSQWAGSLSVQVEARRIPLAQVRRRVLAVLAGLDDLGADEVERAKARWRARWHADLERPDFLAEVLAECWATRGEVDCRAAREAEIAAVTVEQVREVAARWLAPEQASTLSVVPYGDRGFLKGASVVVLP